jgi:hypothetical protein
MVRIFLLILCASISWGAVFTSKATGNWSATGQTTWNEVGVPASGDRVTITHAVTVDANTTVGESVSASISGAGLTSIVVATNVGTVNWTSHGRVAGELIVVQGVTGDNDLNKVYAIQTVPNADSFTITTASVTDNTYNNAGMVVTATAIALSGNGRIIVATGVELKVRGNIVHGNATSASNVIEVSAGGTLSLDPTQDADRTRAIYVVAPTQSSAANSRYLFSGSSGSRATVRTLRTNGDEARGRFTILSYLTGLAYTEATYTDFTDIGDATNDSITGYISSSGFFKFSDCTFTRCGRVNASPTNINLSGIVWFRRNVWTSSLGTTSVLFNALTGVLTGTREFTGNYVDGAVSTLSNIFTITHNVFAGGISLGFLASSTDHALTFENNVVLIPTQASWVINWASMSDCFFLNTYTPIDPDGISARSSVLDTTVDGIIYQITTSVYPIGDNEAFVSTASTAGRNHTFQNSLILQSSDVATGLPTDSSSGVLMIVGNLGAKAKLFHNTYRGTDLNDSGLWISHGAALGSAPADTITEFRSNLRWDTTARGNHIAPNGSGTKQTNAVTPANTTHNSTNLYTASADSGSTGTAYSYPVSGGTPPGDSDVNGVEPRFVDRMRNFEGYSADLYSGARTYAATLELLKADPTTRIPELIAWVRAGFVPQNPALWQSAHDGGTIGAVSANTLRMSIVAGAIF